MSALSTSVSKWNAFASEGSTLGTTKVASRAGTILRLLCLLTAAVNMGGNALLALWYEPIFAWLGLPVPADPYTLLCVLGFSFSSGVVALIIAWMPVHAVPLLVVGMVAKGLFALVTLGFHVGSGVSWPWLVFAAWDAAYVFIFWLYLIQLLQPGLQRLNLGEVLPGVDRPRTGRALILSYSLSGNTGRAAAAVEAGLEAQGYLHCDREQIVPIDPGQYQFPFRSFWQFLRIMVGAILRRPTHVQPLRVAANHDYDLIVCISQTWMVGMAAPVEAVFQDPANQRIFAGRDVAIVNVCRGLWRRSQAMLAHRVISAGGHLVGASAHTNPGREPLRTLSLFCFLAFGQEGRPGWLRRWLEPQFLHQDEVDKLHGFGEKLARRPQRAEVQARAAAAATAAEVVRLPQALAPLSPPLPPHGPADLQPSSQVGVPPGAAQSWTAPLVRPEVMS